MSHGTDATVECPRCGTAFDPSVSGGWCTDSECGAWRYDGATGSDSGRAITDGGTDADGGDGGSADEREGSDDPATTDPNDGNGAAGDDTAEAETVKVRPDSDGGNGTEEAGDDREANGDAGDDEHGQSGESRDDPADSTVACPACETEIAVEDNYCRSCGADVSGIDDSGRLTTCPDCDTEVEPADSFCRECGEHLDVHRPGTDATPAAGGGRDGVTGSGDESDVPAGPAVGSGSSPARAANPPVGSGNGNSSAASAETVKLGGGATAAGPAGETQAEPEPTDAAGSEGPRLSLVARNREIEVGDGDVVGKELRSIIMDTGGDEEDAVRVHREHVRFEHEGEQFYLVDLGQNPTAVNGAELEQGDRVPVEPGDRIDLSGVARIGVRQA